MSTTVDITEVLDDPELLEVMRKAIEDELIEWRDERRFMACGNGFAVREKDGSPSPIIRFRTDIGLRIGLKALADHLAAHPTRTDTESE